MAKASRSLLIAAAPLALLGVAPAPPPADPRLDPERLLAGACGGRSAQPQALRARIALAMAMAPDVPRAAAATATGDVPLVDGLDAVSLPITTSSAEAQRLFNQGLALTYGFNHDGAIRSFRAAQARDPGCAMCFWGEANAFGPNINAPMDPAATAATLKALERAMALREWAQPWERALIEALATRYSADPAAERPALDMAYAQAMRRVAAAHPAHDDIAVLAAEAIMDTRPWDYWEADGRTLRPEIAPAIALVEGVLARTPDHPQAIHLYIHLVEASATPERAEAAADRLARPLTPGTGHLVHMPAHIYQRVGRHRDSIALNLAAAKADEAWLAVSDEAGAYRFGYYPHNVHFIVTSAQLGGDKATALDQSARLQRILGVEVAMALPWVHVIHAAPAFAHAQFSAPAEILAQPAPDARLPYAVAMWRYSRAVAHALGRDAAGVERELAAMRKLRADTDWKPMVDAGVPMPTLIELAEHVAQGRLAMAQGRPAEAVRHFGRAAALEGDIAYTEPPFWYYPVRQSLGAAQLAAGDVAAARQSFMAAVAQAPGNGWALWGLAEAQRRAGDREGLRATQAALERAWLGADRDALTLARL
jgi:tetratricopeptide (TPR) repeat protein